MGFMSIKLFGFLIIAALISVVAMGFMILNGSVTSTKR